MTFLMFQVNVYFGTLNVENISEEPKYPNFTSFFPTIGGILSLYLGLTLVNLFEILEFSIRLIYSIVSSGAKKLIQN